MLDTKAKPYVAPALNFLANRLLAWRLTANQVTIAGFFVGIAAAIFLYFNMIMISIVLLWLSGLMDALDGTMARKTQKTAFGTVLDVTFDRLVEAGIIVSLALKYPDNQFILLLLMTSILIGITVFLVIGNVVKNEGLKSFHYATGIAERTEGFILLTVMMLSTESVIFWTTLLFIVVEVLSTIQRLVEAYSQLDGRGDR
ncbi:CDP-alcohol phosphatidyltransferase family protein [Terrilactibacillus laevilacticus]|uniref:CDP-alcohol phosphatidyltransferase family protein n=1 Tax=Terrilactibacillus laevilacticus TaxID=1380157 RepID=UPI001146BB06|nr:CDP-alcohol phosphatidyltransferase family protein [Terrilactibacillus laevilacticus]